MIPVALGAQSTDSTARAHRGEGFVTKRDLAAAGGLLAASAVVSLLDKELYRAFQDTGVQENRHLRNGAEVFNVLQETYLTLGGLAAYGIGRVTKQRTLADVGFHVAEAVFVASLSSQAIRGPLGRARPTTNGGTDQYDFHPFHGFGEFKYRAFPSIHSASGFAAASVIAREAAQRWPRQKGWIAPVAYAIASTPGLSRMYLGQHWFSDVVMGAGIGIIAGQRVVAYNHRNPRNVVNRVFLGRDGSAEATTLKVGFERRF